MGLKKILLTGDGQTLHQHAGRTESGHAEGRGQLGVVGQGGDVAVRVDKGGEQ